MNETKNIYELAAEGRADQCRAYVDRGTPQKTDNDAKLYKFCCEENFFCSIWAQPWFWITVGCVALAIIILFVLLCVFCCCCRGRLCGGVDKMKDDEDYDTEDSSESSSDSD